MELNTRRNRIVGLAILVSLLLMVPLIAMQFTEEVDWSPFDFVFAGIMLFGTGLAFEVIAMQTGNWAYRAAVGAALTSALFLVWANGAVGLIGNEGEPANLMYLGVLAVGFNGAIIARLRPRGMAYTLFAMAASVALIAGIALLAGMQHYPESSVAMILTVNGFFAELFIVAGLLFRQAAVTTQEDRE